jgi:hypothetical protein
MSYFMKYPSTSSHFVFGTGTETIRKGSNVIDILSQIEHCKVDLNYPWNKSQMIDSFLKMCLFHYS